VRPRPGAAAAPPAFAKVVLFDQHTAVSVTVTTTPPPPPSALRLMCWSMKHATYRYARTTTDHGILSLVTEANARRRGGRT
jgi:hypothetical protein